ncbi:putative phosphoglycerate mutase family domain protein [Phaeomoniella chlamydospora]|uniref:Putative phosphoglycerate mutase family domain protein n=1 Tax=Phaeomoniella chlamydospora TaxID=158046 RepID=A0A0G2E5T1_PHACM|nr:putative phosphoglycerate mutase family domain protein [Phaeomoniella chlamydospora]
MGKPRLIILIRHAQSEGNKNRDIHQSIPDHRVKLTPEGHKQALEAGRKLRQLLRPDDTLHFFTSPYRRTRETTEGILKSLTSDDPSPSPFPRRTIKVYEEPRLREQDFGNFQPCSAEMERMWQERADYGHFFYRIPNGESAADAYDRVSNFNDSLWRRFGEDDFASVCVLVTHGLMTRVFLMKWFHFSVEYFEDLRNINHCEFVVMKRNMDNGKYILQNHLRTWSELRMEREARGQTGFFVPSNPGLGDSSVPVRRRWGGCPNGCNHAEHTKRPVRQNTADMFKDDDFQKNMSEAPHRKGSSKRLSHYTPSQDSDSDAVNVEKPSESRRKPSQLTVPGLDDIISSPDGTPSYISLNAMSSDSEGLDCRSHTHQHQQIPDRKFALLHLGGRDGGGSKSGINSLQASSEEDSDGALHHKKHHKPKSMARALRGDFGGERKEGFAMADALGDQSDTSADENGQDDENDEQRQRQDEENIFEAEKRDRSLRGSVY